MEVTDARQLEFEQPGGSACGRALGEFGALLDWWPGGFTACDGRRATPAVGMTRTLAPGGRLARSWSGSSQYRPEERMLQLTIDQGVPAGDPAPTPAGTRSGRVGDRSAAGWTGTRGRSSRRRQRRSGRFGALVDRGWPLVSGGLSSAVSRG